MPSKKHILQRLSELENQIKILKIDINDHYEPKDVIIKDEYSDLSVEILANGWTSIIAEDGEKRISLGNYPNRRFDILSKMFDKLREIKR